MKVSTRQFEEREKSKSISVFLILLDIRVKLKQLPEVDEALIRSIILSISCIDIENTMRGGDKVWKI